MKFCPEKLSITIIIIRSYIVHKTYAKKIYSGEAVEGIVALKREYAEEVQQK